MTFRLSVSGTAANIGPQARAWYQSCHSLAIMIMAKSTSGIDRCRRLIDAYRLSRQSVVRNRRLPTLKHLCIHVAGVTFTGVILYLTLSDKIFTRPDDHNLNSKLNAMQFVARLHEIILSLSLGSVLMTHLRYEMCVGEGIPFGMVTAAYQLSSPELLFSRGLWSLKLKGWNIISVRYARLRVLVLIALIVTILLGPSSAVLLVPQVQWTTVNDPVSFGGSFSAFLNGTMDELYPQYVDESWVPRGCDPSAYDCGEECPTAFMPGIGDWCNAYLNSGELPNITVSGGNGILRQLTATNSSSSEATVPMFNLSRLLRLFWLWNRSKGTTLGQEASKPRIELTLDADNTLYQPQIRVTCSEQPREYTVFNDDAYYSPENHLLMDPDVDWSSQSHPDFDEIFLGSDISVLVNVTDWTSKKAPKFEFVNITNSSSTTNLGALLGLYLGQLFFFDLYTVIPCTVESQWIPAGMAYEPYLMNTVLSNTLKAPLQERPDEPPVIKPRPLKIDWSYANALNTALGSFSMYNATYTVFEHNMRCLYGTFRLFDGDWSYSSMRSMASMLISLQMADALSRINAHLDGLIWSHASQQGVSFGQSVSSSPESVSRDQFDASVGRFTNITLSSQQYIYSWSIREVTSYLALAVICLHAIAVVWHLAVVYSRNWQCDSWEDMLSLLALAIQSPPATALVGATAKVETRSMYDTVVRIREDDEASRLVIAVDNSEIELEAQSLDSRRPRPGRKYLW